MSIKKKNWLKKNNYYPGRNFEDVFSSNKNEDRNIAEKN